MGCLEAALGLLILVFQLNKLLSSSFRVEIFGIEILEVQKLEKPEASVEEAPAVLRRRPAPRELLPPPGPSEREETPEIFVVVEKMPE